MAQEKQPSLEQITQRDEDGAMYTVSLEIALYANKPLMELAQGATACYRLFIERFGGSLKWYLASSMRREKLFSKKYMDVFPTLCKEEAGITLPRYRTFNGSGMLDYLPPVFATGQYHEFSWLQVHLPSTLANNWDALWSLLTGLGGIFPFRCGHVGFSLCWNDLSADRVSVVPALIGPLLKRYPGLSIGAPGRLCDQKLPPVNWLTLIGSELLQEIGGVHKVGKVSSEEMISVLPLGSGVCIRAGEFPQLGDRNRRDDLPLYRMVGSYLKDYRGQQKVKLYGLDKEESEVWLARFDS